MKYLRILLVILMGATCYGVSTGCSGAASDTTSAFPETCLEVQENAVNETGERPINGTYTLYIDGDETMPWDAYCHNMSRAEPSEYLTVDESNNFSQISDGNDMVAETSYRRYRIDPISLEINPLDTTFADSNFDDFADATLPADLDAIPAGWAEIQTSVWNSGTSASSEADLTGTPFVFSENLEDNDLSNFFCQVDGQVTVDVSTEGSTFDFSSDLTSFSLTAVNDNSEEFPNASTRVVANCETLGGDIADITSDTEASWPLEYVGN